MSSPSQIPIVDGWPPKRGPSLRRYDILWIAGIFIAGGLIAGVTIVVWRLATGSLTRHWQSLCLLLPEINQAEIVAMTAAASLFLGWGGYSLARRRGIDAAALGLRQFPRLWLLGAVALAAMFFWIDGTVGNWVDPTGELGQDFTTNIFPMHRSLFWAVMVAIAIGPITAAGEEILFRGLLYRWFRERMGIKVAVLLSAAIFAVVHFYFLSPGGVLGQVITLDIFVFGLLAAGLYQASGSLWPPILFHALNNGAIVFAAYAPQAG